MRESKELKAQPRQTFVRLHVAEERRDEWKEYAAIIKDDFWALDERGNVQSSEIEEDIRELKVEITEKMK